MMLNYPYSEFPRQFVDALNVHTSYITAGQPNGRPVILLHGMSTSADSFREIMHELADSFWLIAPDIPGFGHSENMDPYRVSSLVEWLASFVAALHLPPVALIGHSFGGLLATSFTISYPEDVTRLLLLAPAVVSPQNYPEMLKKVGISLGLLDLGSALSQSALLVKRQIKVPFFDASKQDESVWERRLKEYELARASASVLKTTAFHDVRASLAEIHQPLSLVWGKNDPVLPHTDGDKIVKLLPHAQLHKFEECGHLPMLEQPEKFLTIAREFLGPV